MFIKDIVGQSYMKWGATDIVFLEAPTGSGKTTFVLEELVPYARQQGKEVLLITNRTILKEQIKVNLAKEQGIPMGLIEGTEAFEGITVVSYQKIQELEENGDTGKYSNEKRYRYIVCDEIHYILEDSLFNPKIYYFMRFLKNIKGMTKILISATMKETKNYLMDNKVLWKYKYDNEKIIDDWCSKAPCTILFLNAYIWQYHMPKQNRKLQVYYFEEYEQIVEKINASDKKWLIFVSNKNRINQSLKDITKKYEIVNADEKKKEIIDQIVQEERFEADVLITTKLLDNGVNFKDAALTNIVIDTISETELLQMLGRKRVTDDEQTTLYIPKKKAKYFTDYFYSNIKKIEDVIKKFDFCNDDIEHLDEQTKQICREDIKESKKEQALIEFFKHSEIAKILYQVVAVYDVESKGVQINEAGKYKIHIISKFLQRMIREMEQDEWAFVKEQLEWLGMESSFSVENDLAVQNDQRVLEEVKYYLESVKDQEMDKEAQNEFTKQMNEYMRRISTESIKNGRELKKNAIENFIKRYQLHYLIDAKGGKKRGEKTQWIIRQEV